MISRIRDTHKVFLTIVMQSLSMWRSQAAYDNWYFIQDMVNHIYEKQTGNLFRYEGQSFEMKSLICVYVLIISFVFIISFLYVTFFFFFYRIYCYHIVNICAAWKSNKLSIIKTSLIKNERVYAIRAIIFYENIFRVLSPSLDYVCQ